MEASPGYSDTMTHFYPNNAQPCKEKRKQIKTACTPCRKARKGCDHARPCQRCVKYTIQEQCIDVERSKRMQGLKRGPYRKRDKNGANLHLMLWLITPHRTDEHYSCRP